MTVFADLVEADRGQSARQLDIVDKPGLEDWIKRQPERIRAAVAAQRFEAKPGQLAILAGDGPDDWSAALGVETVQALSPWCLAPAAARLPEGSYRIAAETPVGNGGLALLGWLLAQHRFERYRTKTDPHPAPVLLTREVAAIDEAVRLAEAVALVRDLIDTPAADMGPADLAHAVETLGRAHGAEVSVTQGDALDEGYPMIAAVGRAATRDRAPRLIELHWGNPAHPRIALVGKGISFDSGGLDLKPASGMINMKKDMGGAAHAIALAQLVMSAHLPVRLHLLVPAAENAVSGAAFRPGDILRSRKGLTVEIGNTDAEGRLVLGDALARAGELDPELLLDFATLTGAARVALGPDLPALFSNDDPLADALMAAANETGDPLWRMPLWKPYGELLKSTVADLNNAGEGGMAGAVTAALFLERFVSEGVAWAHLDTFAWRGAAKPGRAKGGDALGLRAAYAMLLARYGQKTPVSGQ